MEGQVKKKSSNNLKLLTVIKFSTKATVGGRKSSSCGFCVFYKIITVRGAKIEIYKDDKK